MNANITSPDVSVIVCTYNREDKLVNCLNSLLGQTYKNYEIIVVNDKSADNTPQILSKFKNITVVNNKGNLGLSASRNAGAKIAKGNILLFTDDDCIADKNWVKNIKQVYEDSKVDGVGGKIVPSRTDKWLLRYYKFNNPLTHLSFNLNKSTGFFYRFFLYIKRTLSLGQSYRDNARLYSLVGANMSVRKINFDLIGGFDKNIKFGGDESDFWNRLRDRIPDLQLRYADKAIIRHDFDSSFKDALRRNFVYGVGQARHYHQYKNIIPVIFPFPIIILMSLLLVFISPYFLLPSLSLVVLLYPGWILVSYRNRNIKDLTYAYAQAMLEFTMTTGFIVKYLKIII